ncbi:hypothetical protein MNB_SV-15-1040 [hydrothermal vent metagenome]|uniref:DUF5644 domain-containing protein n=1 Tax=hydrothermal vent metagenome TaxID=652676 RepID=A0A1W1EKS5_9ZZZZ
MEFLNTTSLDIKAFFFNAKTDYLPYYKNFSFEINQDDKNIDLKEILRLIKLENENFSYPSSNLVFRVNDLVVTGEEKVATVIERLGNELVITPILEYRSNNGLIINDDDFMANFDKILGKFATDKDREEYKKLYSIYYASESFIYEHNYIGDAIIIMASKMLNDDNRDDILDAISFDVNGINSCEYENRFFDGVDYTQEIESIKSLVRDTHKVSFIDKLQSKCRAKMRKDIEVGDIKSKNVAVYYGNSSENIEVSNEIKINSARRLIGQSLAKINPNMMYNKAGKMLLEAFDKGAEVLIFANSSDCQMVRKNIADIEFYMGREATMSLISVEEFRKIS